VRRGEGKSPVIEGADMPSSALRWLGGFELVGRTAFVRACRGCKLAGRWEYLDCPRHGPRVAGKRVSSLCPLLWGSHSTRKQCRTCARRLPLVAHDGQGRRAESRRGRMAQATSHPMRFVSRFGP